MIVHFIILVTVATSIIIIVIVAASTLLAATTTSALLPVSALLAAATTILIAIIRVSGVFMLVELLSRCYFGYFASQSFADALFDHSILSEQCFEVFNTIFLNVKEKRPKIFSNIYSHHFFIFKTSLIVCIQCCIYNSK